MTEQSASRTVTTEQVEAAEAAIVEMLDDADEHGDGLDALDLAQRATQAVLSTLGITVTTGLEPGDARSAFTLEQVQAREASVVGGTARELLDVLGKVLTGYAAAVDRITDAETRDRHHTAVLAARSYQAVARRRYGVDAPARVAGYATVCDAPSCMTTGPQATTVAGAAAAAVAAGWQVELTNAGLDNVARCPQHATEV